MEEPERIVHGEGASNVEEKGDQRRHTTIIILNNFYFLFYLMNKIVTIKFFFWPNVVLFSVYIYRIKWKNHIKIIIVVFFTKVNYKYCYNINNQQIVSFFKNFTNILDKINLIKIWKTP